MRTVMLVGEKTIDVRGFQHGARSNRLGQVVEDLDGDDAIGIVVRKHGREASF